MSMFAFLVCYAVACVVVAILVLGAINISERSKNDN